MEFDMSRRASLRVGGAAALSALAGCSGALDEGTNADGDASDGPSGDDPAPFRTWIPASLTEADGPLVIVRADVQRVLSEFPDDVQKDLNVDRMAASHGIPREDIREMLAVAVNGNAQHIVLTGSFDPDAVVESKPGVDPEDTSEYEGYTVITERLLASPSAVVISTDYETLVDVERGEAPYLGQHDEEWDRLLSDLAGGTLIGAFEVARSTTSGPSPERIGTAIDSAGGDRAELTGYYEFSSATDAEEYLEKEQDLASELGDESAEVRSVERDGNRVIVEIETETFDFGV